MSPITIMSRPLAVRPHDAPRVRPLPLLLSAAALVLLGACGEKQETATQTAAKVNKDEITVHQINFLMQQQRGLRPDQAEAASRQMLDRLVDQQLALQKAEELKIDRDPRVVQQIDAARREIVARAYVEKVGEAAPRPSPEEVKKYYDDNPALFAERRVYSLQEIAIEAKPEQVGVLREKLQGVKNVGEFVEWLKANDFRFAGNQAVRAAEQLPMSSLKAFANLKDGQAILVPSPTGLQVIALAGSRSQPVALEQARPAIEQFILNDRKRKLIEDDVKTLRAAATIQFVGKFAEKAASAPAGAPSLAQAAAVPASGAAAAAAGIGASELNKGLGIR